MKFRSIKALAAGIVLCAVCESGQLFAAEMAFQVLHEFFPTNGSPRFPQGTLLEAGDATFYGASRNGGTNGNGTVFSITASGAVTTIYSFSSPSSSRPSGGLISGEDGFLYGVTETGGPHGDGTIYRISTNGSFNILHSFDSWADDYSGSWPIGELAEGLDGCFYGSTYFGGTNGVGTLFRITTNGSFTHLLSFDGANGSYPMAGLVAGTNGRLYGTTSQGGANGRGTVFSIGTNGDFATLVSFNLTNGSGPQSRLAIYDESTLVGTTAGGGTYDAGTVFRMNFAGQLETLISFNGTNGFAPHSGVSVGANGRIYGATTFRVDNGSWTNTANLTNGTVFELRTNGILTTLTRFNGTNATTPLVSLTLARDGNVYGVTLETDLHLSLDGNAGIFFRLAQVPEITSVTRTNGNVRLEWTTFTNGVYQVEQRLALANSNWTSVSSNLTASGPKLSFTHATSNSEQGFYRIVLVP